MGQQSKSEGAVLRFAKYYTPVVVSTCVLLIVVPAIMRKQDLKVHCRSAPWPVCSAAFTVQLLTYNLPQQTTPQRVHSLAYEDMLLKISQLCIDLPY